jgi:hypothetical protein
MNASSRMARMSLDVQPPLSKIEGGTEPPLGATACSQSGTDPCAPCRSCRKCRSLPCPENRNLQRGQPNPNVMEVHMICDLTAQIDIRKVAKMASEIPETIHFEGERIVTTWTGTNFGGRRQWFLCPSCDRRCAIIYRRGNGPLWSCRICGTALQQWEVVGNGRLWPSLTNLYFCRCNAGKSGLQPELSRTFINDGKEMWFQRVAELSAKHR